MELIRFNEYHYQEPLSVAIGQFDGLHLAHLALLRKTVEIAKANNYKSAVITFDPHPDFVLKKNLDYTYITPLIEKAKVISEVGIDYLIIINFNKETSEKTPIAFINEYLLAINVKEVVVGSDFCFGIRGTGKAKDIENLSNNLIKTTIFALITKDEIKIGSTIIRELLRDGRVDEVKDWLGRYYQVTGIVQKGSMIGRTLGFPTANLLLGEEFVVVKTGVYAVRITFDDQTYDGIANIGHNPSFNYQKAMMLEVNLFDFCGDLYNKEIKVEFIKHLRDEMVFPSKEAFIKQIENDKIIAIKLFKDIS